MKSRVVINLSPIDFFYLSDLILIFYLFILDGLCIFFFFTISSFLSFFPIKSNPFFYYYCFFFLPCKIFKLILFYFILQYLIG
jgi:hypothetical protein